MKPPRPLTLLALLALMYCILVPQPARAAEEIRSFHAEVLVLPDGALEVTETIEYRLPAGLRKRGIFRDFPLTSPTASGGRAPVTFEVHSVSRNGRPEPYKILREGGDARVRIGQAEVYLPAPSEQTYEIRYRSEGQLRAFEDFDELYWNVTGNNWAFPIVLASITVTLPGRARILQHAAYTGPVGAQGTDFEVTEIAEGLYRARTTAPLTPGEGFTVAVAFPKGLVAISERPAVSGSSRAQLAAFAATLAGALALFAGWHVVGRDPAGGAIYPQFKPPKGIGPAAARYVQRHAFDNRCLTAAIVSMAVKGALRIVEQPSTGWFSSDSFRLEPQGSSEKGLTPAERAAYREMFSTGGALQLTGDKTNGKRMDEARSALRGQLRDEHYGASFLRNTIYTLLGAAVGIVTAGVLMLVVWGDDVSLSGQFTLWLTAAVAAAFAAFCIAILWAAIGNLRGVGVQAFAKPIYLMVGIGVAAAFLPEFLEKNRALFFPGHIDFVVLAAGAVFGVIAVLFHILMAAPTKSGRRLMDHIEGFALYLGTAEEERLNVLNPPDRTPALFERLLPYAIALGLSHEWSAKFAGVLSATTMPDWYHGSGRSRFDADRLDSNLSSAVSATSAPSSGSGSGGGGFSGGGGGGGGGGSW